MKRTLTIRCLAVGLVCLAISGLNAGSASALGRVSHHHTVVTASGTWVDPGPTITSVTPAGDKYQVDMTGGTTSTGDFTGVSTYTLSVIFDPALNTLIGCARETYAATLAGRGSGHVTFAERVRVNADGSEVVTGYIVAGDGVFRDARGLAVFRGTTDPTGPNPSTGSYQMLIELAQP
ncbi:hypothetical protein [Aquihabitans sp. McL0605]|uniref:hypothetical protein n=1 Tax=Aquihabitans sp. McL0605 TaxID=3415671 RepID=UPI003CF20FB4